MDKEKKLTARQAEILGFIEEHVAELQTPPTYREIAAHFGLSAVGTIQDHVQALRDKGYLAKKPSITKHLPRQARGFKLTAHTSALSIPVLGEVPAGSPLEAIPSAEGSIPFEATSREKLFALKVKGESMKNAGILHGDFIIVRQQPHARNGQIVVAMVEGEATVKRLEQKRGLTRLMPENEAFAPIEVPEHALDGLIQGVVIGVQRRLLD